MNLFVDNVETGYRYRPDGLRHSKSTLGVTTTHLWDGQNIVAEIGVNDEVHSRYLRGVNLIARKQDGQNQFYHFNAHGDVVQRTDSNGVVLKAYEYDAFGVERDPEPMDANPWRYCGEYWDRESKTVYLRARSYEPRTGRFGSEDIACSGLNWYAYCENNPIRYVDPKGLSANDILYGLTESMDENLTDGLAKWIVSQIRPNSMPNSWTGQAAKDYYTGRVVGDVLSALIGAGTSVKGIIDIVGSIAAGTAVTVGSGGTLTVGGVAISAAGIAVGTAELAYGGAVAISAVDGLSQDWAVLSEMLGNGGGSSRIGSETWGQGNFNSISDSQLYHYNEHGTEIGAKNIEDYLRKAEAFKDSVLSKKIKSDWLVDGATPDVYRYVYNGRYIDLQRIYDRFGFVSDYKIISYGIRR